MKSQHRNVLLLAFCQAMMMSSNSLIITSSALVGYALAADKALATLPLAAQFIAAMFTAIPASLLMERIGRRPGFLLATTIGMTAGVITTTAIIQQNFWLFISGTTLVGIFNGFGNYYRFAAADSVETSYKSRAISYVMAGGVIAAFLGPNLANWSQHLIGSAQFAGSYAAIIGLYLLSFSALLFTRLPTPEHKQGDIGRPLSQIARQPRFIVALLNGMLGYGVMALVMTATPLAMQHSQHPFGDTAFVIQWHVLGMFAPSFFTGNLIRRFGVLNIMLIGGLLGVGCVMTNLTGTSVWHYWLALLLLGLSWNFLFIGATTLLTETYRPEERAKTQATNDFAVFTTVTLSSLSAGALQHHLGWQAVNIGVMPMLAVILLSLIWLKLQRPQATAETSA